MIGVAQLHGSVVTAELAKAAARAEAVKMTDPIRAQLAELAERITALEVGSQVDNVFGMAPAWLRKRLAIDEGRGQRWLT